MKIEIWSDIMCPFCYIGKRKFEKALEQFDQKDKIDVEWKSFQLSPEIKTQTNKSSTEFLAEHKGISIQQARALNEQVSQMAKTVGLTYHLDKSVVANSFKAHQLTHFAKQYQKQDETEELLFKAHFTEGKNIDNTEVLLDIGEELGFDRTLLKKSLEDNLYADAVKKDIQNASRIGVRGVPFFLFNNKYALSGAQESETFLQALKQSFTEWTESKLNRPIQFIEGQSCDVDGNCD